MFRFGLKNLRRLEDVSAVDLKQITILVGRNSSGKSTFLRSLPLLRQSVTTRTSSPILWYGDWVDFGDFDGAVFQNNTESNVSFIFGMDDVGVNQDIFIEEGGYFFTRRKGTSTEINIEIKIAKHKTGTRISSIVLHEALNDAKFEVSIDLDNRVSGLLVDGVDVFKPLEGVDLVISGGTIFPTMAARPSKDRRPVDLPTRAGVHLESLLRQRLTDMLAPRLDKRMKRDTRTQLVQGLLDLDVVSKATIRDLAQQSQNRSWEKLLNEISKTDRNNLFSSIRSIILTSKIQAYLNSFSQRAKGIISSVLYIGPARAKSDRYYRYQDLAVSEIDPDGKNFPMFLNSLSQREIESFSSWVRQYFGFGVQVSKESGHISIKLIYDSNTVNIVDTGYGVSQILPVLGQVWWARNKGRYSRIREREPAPVIVIEQPELHLHPAHQARLADAFVNSLQDETASNKGRAQTQFVIETHSEALINRMGALIADGKIESGQVQILIFEQDEENDQRTNVRVVPFDDDGQLIDWPYGFFSPTV